MYRKKVGIVLSEIEDAHISRMAYTNGTIDHHLPTTCANRECWQQGLF